MLQIESTYPASCMTNKASMQLILISISDSVMSLVLIKQSKPLDFCLTGTGDIAVNEKPIFIIWNLTILYTYLQNFIMNVLINTLSFYIFIIMNWVCCAFETHQITLNQSCNEQRHRCFLVILYVYTTNPDT